MQFLWLKGLPFKFLFLAQRVWLGKVPIATIMNSWNANISQFCNCCSNPMIETIEHLFLKGEVTAHVWGYFTRAASITRPLIQLKQVVKMRWNKNGNSRLNVIFQVNPILCHHPSLRPGRES